MSDKQEQLIHSAPERLATHLAALMKECKASSLIIICDSKTRHHCYERLDLHNSLPKHRMIELPQGEQAKHIDVVLSLWEELLKYKLDRQAMLCALGGGAITDVVGFVAATYKRGVTLVNIPTTLLAMVDAAIGGKTAINFSGTKNMIGSFYPAKATIVVTQFLDTLPVNELLSGYGEVVKYAWLLGEKAWQKIATSSPSDITPEMISECIAYKQSVVAKDPHDQGLRKVLNLGHTTAHAFEAFYKSKGEHLPHGFAVANGIYFALYLSFKLHYISSDLLYQYGSWLKENYPPLHYMCDDYTALIELMHQDKKNVSRKEISMVLLKGIGMPFVADDVKVVEITEAFDCYKDFFGI